MDATTSLKSTFARCHATARDSSAVLAALIWVVLLCQPLTSWAAEEGRPRIPGALPPPAPSVDDPSLVEYVVGAYKAALNCDLLKFQRIEAAYARQARVWDTDYNTLQRQMPPEELERLHGQRAGNHYRSRSAANSYFKDLKRWFEYCKKLLAHAYFESYGYIFADIHLAGHAKSFWDSAMAGLANCRTIPAAAAAAFFEEQARYRRERPNDWECPADC